MNALKTRAIAPLFLLSFSVIPASSCTSGSAPGVETVRRDSAGIVIVENRGSVPLDGGGWSVAQYPSLSIGAVEGEEDYQFFGIAGAHRLTDGRIAVVNSGSRNVRVYDADGAFLASYGQRGGGPEEFEMPGLAGTRADTLIIVDRAHHRLAMVHPDVGFVRLARVEDEVGGFLNPSGTFANGQSVFGGAFDMRRIGELQNGMNRAHTFYRSCNPDGSMAVDFGDKEGAEFFIKDLEGSGQDSQPAVIPFGKLPVATVSPSHFFFSSQDAFEIEVYAPSGELERMIRKNWDPESVTAEDGTRHIEAVVEQVGDDTRGPEIRRYLGALPVAEAFPPHGALLADVLDYLWVQDFQKLWEDQRDWTIFDAEGTLSGRVTLPPNFNPVEIGADYILGVGWDEMNVEYVRMFSLRRPG